MVIVYLYQENVMGFNSVGGISQRKNVLQYHVYSGEKQIMLVYTVGTWDLLHVGHLAILQHCKTLGDTVAVGVASDDVVASYKRNRPVVPLEQRMKMLKALRCVDIVRPYHELEYTSACRELGVDIFVIGEDWGKAPHNLDVESFLKSAGKSVVQVNYHPQTSSTKIKAKTIAQLHAVA